MTLRFLIIEDNVDDFEAITGSLGRACSDVVISHSWDGDEALDSLRNTGQNAKVEPLPDVILLDLNLPGTSGREILAEIKTDEQLKAIPVVILTTSALPRDVTDCYDRGANGYFLKALDRVEFDETIQAIDGFWLRAVALPERLYST